MKNLKNLNKTTMIALSLLLTTGVSPLNNLNQGEIINIAYAAESLSKGKIVTVTTNGSTLNLRRKPSTGSDSAILASLKSGTKLKVISSTQSWANVEVIGSGKEGYVSLNYIDNGKYAKTIGSSVGDNFYVVVSTNTGGKLNVRKEATTNSSIIGSLNNGTKVKVYAETNKWYKVHVNGKYGWISQSRTKKTNAPTGGTVSNDYGSLDITDRLVSINSNNVNARSGPGLNYSIKKKYKKGTQVTITHSKLEDGYTWYRVKDDGSWVASKFTTDVKSSGSSSSSSSSKIKYTTPAPGSRFQVTYLSNGTTQPGGGSYNLTFKPNYVYNYVQKAEINNNTYYKLKALASDRTAWVHSSYGRVVTKRTHLGGKKTVTLAQGTHLYTTSACTKKVNNIWLAPYSKVEVLSASSTAVKVKSGNYKGWVNKGLLQFGDKGFRNVENSDPRQAIREALVNVVDEDLQIDSSRRIKVTSVSEPILTEMNVSTDEKEPYYINQYVVDVTFKDGDKEKVETVRFDANDSETMKDIMSEGSITLYLDEDEETKDSLPPYVIETKVIDAQLISKLAKDYVEIARVEGIEIDNFTDDEIKEILGQ